MTETSRWLEVPLISQGAQGTPGWQQGKAAESHLGHGFIMLVELSGRQRSTDGSEAQRRGLDWRLGITHGN